MFIIYDTETTGIPEFSKPSIDPCQPRIVQLAALLVDRNYNEVGEINRLIKPEGWTVDELGDAFKAHGKTNEMLNERGVPIAQAIEEFLKLNEAVDQYRVGHNESFDARMMRIEFQRMQMEDVAEAFKVAPTFCTQRESKAICNLPPSPAMVKKNIRGPKTPKLEEAYLHFTGGAMSGQHDAMNDVRATLEVYKALMGMGKAKR